MCMEMVACERGHQASDRIGKNSSFFVDESRPALDCVDDRPDAEFTAVPTKVGGWVQPLTIHVPTSAVNIDRANAQLPHGLRLIAAEEQATKIGVFVTSPKVEVVERDRILLVHPLNAGSRTPRDREGQGHALTHAGA